MFDTVSYEKLPAIPLKMIFATSIAVTPDDVHDNKVSTKFEIYYEETVVFKAEGEPTVDIESNTNLISAIELSGQVAFSKGGTYIARLYVDDNVIADYTFFLKPKEAQ